MGKKVKCKKCENFNNPYCRLEKATLIPLLANKYIHIGFSKEEAEKLSWIRPKVFKNHSCKYGVKK